MTQPLFLKNVWNLKTNPTVQQHQLPIEYLAKKLRR